MTAATKFSTERVTQARKDFQSMTTKPMSAITSLNGTAG